MASQVVEGGHIKQNVVITPLADPIPPQVSDGGAGAGAGAVGAVPGHSTVGGISEGGGAADDDEECGGRMLAAPPLNMSSTLPETGELRLQDCGCRYEESSGHQVSNKYICFSPSLQMPLLTSLLR